MTFDIYATLVIAVLTALMAFIGIEMVNNPPSKKWHKWAWRITFIVISLPLIVIEVKVAIHTDDERQQTEEKGNKERLESRGDIRFMEGKLDAIASFESEYLANPQKQKPPQLPCQSTSLNLVATWGPARLLSTSIEGLSANTTALGPLIVQFKV